MQPENELAFLREAVPDLKNYLLSKDLYWPLHSRTEKVGGGQLTQLTIGNLSFSLAYLSMGGLSAAQDIEYQQLSTQIGKFRSEWLSNWRLKAGKEFAARLNLWQQSLRELHSDSRKPATFYVHEVRVRVVLELLADQEQAELPAGCVEQLQMLDQILRGLLLPGAFIWEERCAVCFPQDKFWFLYGSLKG